MVRFSSATAKSDFIYNNGYNLYDEQQRSFYVHEQQTARNSVGTSDILYTYFNNGASEVKLNVERDPMLPPLCNC